MDDVLRPIALALAPEAIVLTCGADALAGDPLAKLAFSNRALWACAVELAHLAPAAVVQGGGGYNPWLVARYWTGLWGRLTGRAIPDALPQAACTILQRLECDLVDAEDVDPHWLTTLADPEPAQPAAVRPELRRVVDTALALIDRAIWRLPPQRSTFALAS